MRTPAFGQELVVNASQTFDTSPLHTSLSPSTLSYKY